jgi:hypothetical protein
MVIYPLTRFAHPPREGLMQPTPDRPTWEDAVLLAVRCFHKDRETSISRSVHLSDVARAVGRINQVRADDGIIKQAYVNEVQNVARGLRARGLLEFEPLAPGEVRLTRAGMNQAASIEQSQLWIDTGIVGRIQHYSRFEIRTRLQEPEREHTLESRRRGYSMGR